ncbi:C40 family peptidase [Paenibacillus crassostreae]|uniref:Hydrolase n=1 Tax=Paenibacillus crassostreae TaxID=1763538 RepID=A0A167DSY3_9BACL|nr:C40 family peptidase [Paenibacillus crassostreae]AOZ91098.1 hydrolase [Paenibacillus crassostreae]OAB74742.1 hydrolase [Paenibacillus crassostreae]
MTRQTWTHRLAIVGICSTLALGGAVTIANPVAEAATTATASTTKANKIINYGKSFLGVPYKFGASTSTTRYFDCSSLMKRIYGKFGVTLPRTSAAQAKKGVAVSKANLKKGDLLFFSTGSRSTGRNITHVGMYIGNGNMLHTYGSPGVMITNINKAHWKKTYVKARRVL